LITLNIKASKWFNIWSPCFWMVKWRHCGQVGNYTCSTRQWPVYSFDIFTTWRWFHKEHFSVKCWNSILIA